jgi:hypothetical protein
VKVAQVHNLQRGLAGSFKFYGTLPKQRRALLGAPFVIGEAGFADMLTHQCRLNRFIQLQIHRIAIRNDRTRHTGCLSF